MDENWNFDVIIVVYLIKWGFVLGGCWMYVYVNMEEVFLDVLWLV